MTQTPPDQTPKKDEGIGEKIFISVASSVAVGILGILGANLSNGTVVSLLGGVSKAELAEKIAEAVKALPPGKDGAAGKDGVNGKDGADGKDGLPGLPGTILPKGAVIAFDLPEGCQALGDGWVDANLGGQFIAGAISGNPTWDYHHAGGAAAVTLQPANIPPLYLKYHTKLSGSDVTISMVEDLTFSNPGVEPYLRTSSDPAAAFSTLPPFMPLYLCRKS